MKKKIVIVGAGPAGLFCSYLLLKNGHAVDLYDQSSGPAKKFLVAGNGGLNLTHSEKMDDFVKRYGKDEALFKGLLNDFSPTDLRDWCSELGVETFVGSSGRIFPTKMKSADILLRWIDKLKSYDNFNLYLKHRLVGMTKDKEISFKSEKGNHKVKVETLILALGGSSWKKTGSDGLWENFLKPLGIELNKFLPMNCGFERKWSDFFKKNIERTCLKHVEVSFQGKSAKGDLMLTPYGIEGGVIYALSNHIRDEILKNKKAIVSVDLKPTLSKEIVIQKLESKPKKTTMSNHLRKALKIDKYSFILLKELLKASDFESIEALAKSIKQLDIELVATRSIDEAISTSGGVCFSELSESLEVNKIPGLYIVGEMLDFEAPTGGYLLQGCFSSAWRVVNSLSRN